MQDPASLQTLQPAAVDQVLPVLRRVVTSFDPHAAVFQNISERLQGRLDLLSITPVRVLDLGCRTGYQVPDLQRRYPVAEITGFDLAPGKGAEIPLHHRIGSRFRRLAQRTVRHFAPFSGGCFNRRYDSALVAGDPHRLPFADGVFDLVVSNLLLPWCEQPHRVFSEVNRVLASGGAFLFTSAGPDTLIEYRSAWAGIDAWLHVFGLVDIHDLGDSMTAAGFAAPVLDRENITVDYPSIAALQHELRQLGAANVARDRRTGLMAPSVRSALSAAAASTQNMARFPVTFELIHGHAWKKTAARHGAQTANGYSISLEKLRLGLKR